MASTPKWNPELFENALEGVSSAVTPELISRQQLAWGKNIVNRGAKPGTRPPFKRLCTLPSGLVQGAGYFGVQGGMGVASINGHIYRLRINANDASFEEILLPWWNSPVVKQVYMQQTVETLVIQDGQSNPILYNGSTAVRSVPSQSGVPLGRQMAYGNGRLWVAINGKELVAGDIRSNLIGSELLFTETDYLSGGGTFFFPRGITGLNFIATTGTSDYGALMIFGSDYADSLRADITFRDLWAQTPGFITSVLRHTGAASQWSLGQVNQDLFWRDAGGGIRSIRSSLSDESGVGNSPISREVSRLTDYDSPQLLSFCSAISFNNRLIVTSSPRLNKAGGVTWESLIALDFAPISTMRGKTLPAYDGQWEGLNFTHLFQGQIGSRSRAFAITLDDGGSNTLWEIMPDGRGPLGDETVSGCTDGSAVVEISPIVCSIEHGRRSFGNSAIRKRLERCDVYLSGIQGEVGLRVFWRSDNNQKWQEWDETIVACATDGDPENPDESIHVWKNLLPQQRPQLKSFTIPSAFDNVTHYSLITGFEFQIRLVWTGRLKIYKTVLYSTFLDDPPFAMRDILSSQCLDNDVTGNEITYEVTVSPCPFIEITQNPQDVVVDFDPFEAFIFEQYDGPIVFPAKAFAAEGEYFTAESAFGQNRVFLDTQIHPLNPNFINGEIPVVQTDPVYPKGVFRSAYSGTSIYDIATDSYTGGITVTVEEGGFLPNGANSQSPARDQFSVFGETYSAAVALAIASGRFFFLSRSVMERKTKSGMFARSWYSNTPGANLYGSFVFGNMNGLWVDGYTHMLLYSVPLVPHSMGIPVARTGEAARTQELTGYDSVSRTYTGTKSRARKSVAIPAGKTKMTGDFKFLVTPSDFSEPYYIWKSVEYDVTPSTNYEAVVEFPWIAESQVYFDDYEFSFRPSVYLGYGAFTQDREYTSLPGTSTWPEDITFGSPPPNADAWDDFEDYGGSDTDAEGEVLDLSTGYGWVDAWFFDAHSPVDCYDDFESYPDGEISVMTQGVGWASAGTFFVRDRGDAYDDFESYPDGVILSWDVPGAFWRSVGFFIP